MTIKSTPVERMISSSKKMFNQLKSPKSEFQNSTTMKQTLLLISFFAANVSFTQVGVVTTDSQADLDVRTTNPGASDAAMGIAIPQVDALPTTRNRA